MNQLQDLLTNFETVLDQSIGKTWEAKNLPVNLEVMASEATNISTALVSIGDFCYQELLENEAALTEKQRFAYNWVCFEWTDLAKEFMILWRDILFQQQKGQIMKIDRLTSAASLRTLNLQSQETLEKAIYDFKGDVERGFNIIEKKRIKKVKQWSLQQNPWPIYKKQLLAMADQCQVLQTDYRVLLNVATNFNEIEDLVRQTEKFCAEEIKEVKAIADKTIADIENENLPKLGQIVKHLEDLEAGISLPNHFNSFTNALEHRINAIIAMAEMPVGVDGGMVEIKDLTFKRSTKQWLDAEILPILYEIWELTENTHNGLKMALINIKNRAILLDADEKEGKKVDMDKATISQPLNAFYRVAAQAEASLTELRAVIDERLLKDFNVSEIYDTERAFLPIPIQAATLNQFRKGQNKLQNRVGGESFAVGREKELAHAKSLIDNWRDGFRGAVVITGERFSGKTILGELIANQFFDNNTIRLTPDTLINLDGRRMTTGFDLEPVLAFVKKYGTKKKPLIWIDDLELWWDRDLFAIESKRANASEIY